jgi:hypothetical protein
LKEEFIYLCHKMRRDIDCSKNYVKRRLIP